MPTSGHLARGRLPLALFAALIALLAFGATSAFAATVSFSGGTVTFTGDADNDTVTVTADADGYIISDDDPIANPAGAECEPAANPDDVECTKASTDAIVLNLLAGADNTTFTSVGDDEDDITVTQNGGDDADTLRGTQGGDLTSNGDGGDDPLVDSFSGGTFGNAVLNGGPGNDFYGAATSANTNTDMINSAGGDTFENGPGFEEVTYAGDPGPVTITLDGQANDGASGENDNVGNVDSVVGSAGADTITGNDGDQRDTSGSGPCRGDVCRSLGTRGGFGFFGGGLSGGPGNDTINGLGGNDVLSGDDGDDTVNGGAGIDNASGGAGNDTVNGDDGADGLTGGDGNDTLNGGADGDGLTGGAGNDTLNGGDGDDGLNGGAGGDNLFGNAGFDSASVDNFDAASFDPVDATVTLDDVANDGRSGEGDNYHSDIEDLSASFGDGRVNFTGSGAFNILSGDVGNDTLDGAAGADLIRAGAGDDTVNARDGSNDRIDCGPGNDTANVDQFDEVSNCETVNRANVAAANANRNPTVSFASPASNSRLPGNTPTRVVVNASDDQGVARVILLDEDRTVGTDTTAPYEFSYQATGDDVGKNTLVAVAVDASDNASNAIRNVRVNRFRPNIRGVIRPARDRTAPFRFRVTGGITLPRFVTRAQGCRTGFVSVQVKRRSKTISTRRVKIKRTCGFSSTVTFRNTRRLGNGRLKFTVRWLGNSVLAPRTARSVNVRAG